MISQSENNIKDKRQDTNKIQLKERKLDSPSTLQELKIDFFGNQ